MKHSKAASTYASELLRTGFFPLLLLLGLSVPMILGLFALLAGPPPIFRGGREAVGAAQLALLLVVFAVLSGLPPLSRIPAKVFIGLAVLVGAGVKLGYAWAVDTPPVSDFAALWKFATLIPKNGMPPVLSIYSDRIIPFLLPVAWAFGRVSLGYRLANAVALLVCAGLTYDLARRHFGERAARPALLLALFAPETLMASAIPTHDVPGALYLLVALWILDHVVASAAEARWGVAATLSVLLGLVLELLELQRGLRPFWVLGVGLFLIAWLARARLSFRPAAVVLAVCLLVPIGVQSAVHASLVARKIALSNAEREKFSAQWFAVSSDSWSEGAYDYEYQSYIRPYRRFSAAEWRELGLGKFLTDAIRSPLERPRNAVRKSGTLFRLGSQYGFYVTEGFRSPIRSLTSWRLLRDLEAANTVFVIAYGLLFFGSTVVVLWRRGLPLRAWPPLLVLCLLSLALILVGEVQPRYVFPVWFVAPLVVSASLADPAEKRISGAAAAGRIALAAAISGFGLLAGWLILRASFARSDRLFLDLDAGTRFSAESGECADSFLHELQPARAAERRFRIVLQHPGRERCGARVAALHPIPVEGNAPRDLVLRIRSPWRDGPIPSDPFTAVARVGGREIARVPASGCPLACTVRAGDLRPREGRLDLELSVETDPRNPPAPRTSSVPVTFEFLQLRRP